MSRWTEIVVGIDGSEGSHRALRWAYEEARVHGAKLLVVTAWMVPAPPVAPPYGSFPWEGSFDFSETAKEALTTSISEVLGSDPGVEVESEVVEGNAPLVLLEKSATADLLVVGSRGHGAFAGMLLGSVSQHVTAHAKCPVVVIR
jgi:nucleotide-binding universal stress UspA family protein